MKLLKQTPALSLESRSGRVERKQILLIVYTVILLVVSSLLQSVPPLMLCTEELMNTAQDGLNKTGSFLSAASYTSSLGYSSRTMCIMLFSTLLGAFAVFVYCYGFERRSLRTLGFVKKGALRSYLLGAVMGLLMFTAVTGVTVALGGADLNGFSANLNKGMLLAFLGGFLIQGMYEEIFFRGYYMISSAVHGNTFFAVVMSGILFSLAHCLNPGVTPLALFNIALFGCLMCVLMLMTGNIWAVGALHSLWNFTQSNVFGVSTSGTNMGCSILNVSADESKPLISGGAFGFEGGLPVTLVLAITLAVLLFIQSKREATEKNGTTEDFSAAPSEKQ